MYEKSQLKLKRMLKILVVNGVCVFNPRKISHVNKKVFYPPLPPPTTLCIHQLVGPAPALKGCYVIVCGSSVTVRRVMAASLDDANMLSPRQFNVAIPFAYLCFHKESMQFAWGEFHVSILLA